MLNINEIATDCYSFISWEKRNFQEVPSNSKINWILPHFENKWGCHRLLSICFMEEKKLERGTLKFQDQRSSSTFWKQMKLPQIAIHLFHGRTETWKRYPQISRSIEFFHILKVNEIATYCYLFIYVMVEKKLERGTLKFKNQMNSSTF